MKRLKLTRERRERFLTALAETGIVSLAAGIAGTSRTRIWRLKSREFGRITFKRLKIYNALKEPCAKLY